ncbi:Crp/Fnr family transcriptional regulator [Bittarella massiliensis (ex Durand et al. 2017)]|uniref:Crp/Fnr family transcriptional regulator n=1 Tax=Bittarella massiliensis (ex Durand et al. 2017) TaxID=1720313 RepID=UPI00073F3483|nr:Crp/Fnr family transcriptional regulator [Bittarella massiliensis (ex Durand et al. 2017)]
MDSPYQLLRASKQLGRWRPVSFAAGQTIFSPGEIAVHVYLLLEGQVCTLRLLPNGTYLAGRPVGPDIFLGELNVLTGEASLVKIEAVTPCRALQITAGEFMEIIRDDPALSLWEAQYCAQGILNYTRQVVFDLYRPAKERVAEYLWTLAQNRGQPLAVDKDALAAILGSTVRTVNRYLKELRDDGVIALVEGGVAIADPARLKRRFRP